MFTRLLRTARLALAAFILTAPLAPAADDPPASSPQARARMQELLTALRHQTGSAAERGTACVAAARTLLKEFPAETGLGGSLLVRAAQELPKEQSRAVLNEIQTGNFPTTTKSMAAGLQTRLEALGQPFEMKFTALDGRQVDVQAMKGKVVLIDFWATWCGPCVAELPNVLAVYERLHDRGFEIVSISFDSDRAKLEKFITDRKMPWPQYFDGKGWSNEFGRKWGVRSIPMMMLVDKKGIFRSHTRQERPATWRSCSPSHRREERVQRLPAR